MDSVTANQPMSHGVLHQAEPQVVQRGTTGSGLQVVPLERPRSYNPGRLFEEPSTQPPLRKASLFERMTYPFRAAGQRLENEAFAGGIAGGLVLGSFGACIGGAVGAGVGACIGGLAKLATADNSSVLKGVLKGTLVGAAVGGSITGLPGAIIGALGLSVCSLASDVIRFPLDIIHAFRSASPEMPANLPEATFRKLYKYAQELLDTTTLFLGKRMSLSVALDELGLEAESLNKNKLDKTFRMRSLHVHPDKKPDDPGAELAFKRLSDAKETLAQALELKTPLPRLVELQKKLAIKT